MAVDLAATKGASSWLSALPLGRTCTNPPFMMSWHYGTAGLWVGLLHIVLVGLVS